MLFSDHPRTHYEKTLTHEVICQLRFPTILTINNTEPADFQEAVREDFPQYARRQDQLPPRVVNGKPEPQAPVTNYHFLSQDGRWKLNLTRDFIALSTLSYPGWEEFARMLDKVASALGPERAGRFHSHFSRIEFTPKGGEKCHRTFADHGGFGPDWEPLAAEIARRGWSPTFICESAGTQAEDACTMQQMYRAARDLRKIL